MTNEQEINNSNQYEVGYGKPPKSGQFKKGVSGNPRGRKKKIVPCSLFEAFQLELSEKSNITITNGHKENVYKYELFAKIVSNNALRGDKAALKFIMDMFLKTDLLYARKHLEEKYIEINNDSQNNEEMKNKLLEALDKLLLEQNSEES